jgi:hypothetical protein
MATYTHRETTIRRTDVILPVPAVGAELAKAYLAAERMFRDAHGLGKDVALADDVLTVTVTDDAVVIGFEVADR